MADKTYKITVEGVGGGRHLAKVVTVTKHYDRGDGGWEEEKVEAVTLGSDPDIAVRMVIREAFGLA